MALDASPAELAAACCFGSLFLSCIVVTAAPLSAPLSSSDALRSSILQRPDGNGPASLSISSGGPSRAQRLRRVSSAVGVGNRSSPSCNLSGVVRMDLLRSRGIDGVVRLSIPEFEHVTFGSDHLLQKCRLLGWCAFISSVPSTKGYQGVHL